MCLAGVPHAGEPADRPAPRSSTRAPRTSVPRSRRSTSSATSDEDARPSAATTSWGSDRRRSPSGQGRSSTTSTPTSRPPRAIRELPRGCRRAVTAAHDSSPSCRRAVGRRGRSVIAHARPGPRRRKKLALARALGDRGRPEPGDDPVRAVVVIGGGIAGLATAALLAPTGPRHPARGARRARRPGRDLGARRLPLRHRALVVPHARGVRPLLPPARHDARPELDLVPLDPATGCTPTATERPARRPRVRADNHGALRVGRARRGAALDATSTRRATPTTSRSTPLPLHELRDDPRACATRGSCCAAGRSSRRCWPRRSTATSPPLHRPAAAPGARLSRGVPRIGSPYGVPSLYHLMSHLDLDEGVLYPQGGFADVIERIAALAERPAPSSAPGRDGGGHRGDRGRRPA